jgi:hypothetical protein
MLMRLKIWAYMAALVGGGALLQFGGCGLGGGFGNLNRWDAIMLAILQEELFS